MIAHIRRWLDLRPGEAAAVAWAAGMFFAVLTSYYVLRPVRDAFVLDGDPNFVTWLFTATFVLMLVIAPPWGALVARWPRHQLVPWAYRAMTAQLVLFAAAIAAGAPAGLVGKVFYVWVSMFNLFVVSVFWSLCADIARPEQGRRLFGMIAAGGTAGALLGPTLTKFLAEHIGIAGLLLISAVFLELAVRCARFLDRADRRLQALRATAAAAPEAAAPPTGAAAVAPVGPAEPLAAAPAGPLAADRAIGGSPLAGFTGVARSPYLAGIAFYMMLTATLATLVYFRQLPIVKAAITDRVARTVFYADLELWSSLATLCIQLLLTARVLRWLGVGVVLALLPVVQGAGVLWLIATPTLAVFSIVSPLSRALTHSLARPSRELLFTAVSREDKFKAKNVVDTFAYRFGDFASAWLNRGLASLAISAAYLVVPLAAGWIALSLALGLGYRRRTVAPASPAAPPTVRPAA